MEEVFPKAYHRKKQKGKRDADLENLPVKVISHELSDDELRKHFGNKRRSLPDEVYKRLFTYQQLLKLKNIMLPSIVGQIIKRLLKAIEVQIYYGTVL